MKKKKSVEHTFLDESNDRQNAGKELTFQEINADGCHEAFDLSIALFGKDGQIVSPLCRAPQHPPRGRDAGRDGRRRQAVFAYQVQIGTDLPS